LKFLDKEIGEIAKTPVYRDKVEALCAYRGIGVLTAMILLTEVVSFNRFSDPRQLMAYLGLVPNEYSSGGKRTQGSITKCGNRRVRRALIETSWHYLYKPVITDKMSEDLKKVAPELRHPAEKALMRLHKRYFSLLFKGKPKQKAIVAVARGLCGFIWSSMVYIERIA
jgi:transposase